MNVSWEVEGLDELDKKLTQLGAEIGIKALRKSARAAMKPVKEQMIQNAPFDEGKSTETYTGASKEEVAARSQHLKDKIGITTKKLDRKGGRTNALSVRVGPTKAHTQKAVAAEYGTSGKKHKNKSKGHKQAAKPFMRPALYDNKELVVRTMKTVLALEISKLVAKG